MEAAYGGSYFRVRASLGASGLGIQVIQMPPHSGDLYPLHDHSDDGQEEIYLVLDGSGEIEVDGERHPLDPDVMVRVGPRATRKIWPGPEGMRVLALGGTPGKVYEPPDVSKLGEPDPLAQRSA